MTAEKVRTNVYLNSQTKAKALEIFKRYGLGLSDAINIFLTQAVIEKGIPFDIKIPNKATKQAIKEANKGKVEEISLEELKEQMKQCVLD